MTPFGERRYFVSVRIGSPLGSGMPVVEVDRRKLTAHARSEQVEFDIADADAFPRILGVRLDAIDQQIRPEPLRRYRLREFRIEMIDGGCTTEP